ncbi:MAG: alpha/beta fold hydrolase [Acidimicrobiia bacterium]
MTWATSAVTLRNGLTLSYREQGDPSGPALVLVPGPTDSWWSYRPVLERLPPSLRVVAVSPRGHGDSDKPASGYRVVDFAGDAVALIDALGIDRVVLAGHSGSCLVVRRAAIDRPERVAGLILEASPVTLRGHRRFETFVESVIVGLTDPIDADFARSFVTDTSSDVVDPDLLVRAVDEVRKVPAHVWREMFSDLLHYDDREELGRLVAPTLLVWGDDDELVDEEMQTELVSLIPNAELLVYAGAGHTPRWDAPARFAADTAALVERCVHEGRRG